ncbi:hypothetical protein K491DRAFT_757905 [Lophiostoma macrostomum CBS 122681]|uniref:Uncharacterized protein n=1 Tax=Lophiostoma macrostomum CBS 122681 TaxID=1314788 RepID=A0A6A6T856_9PLEO|nr:hypothetical protein K491DRAFT_757905 [Lophiostoma macrostomum CBS 122681]
MVLLSGSLPHHSHAHSMRSRVGPYKSHAVLQTDESYESRCSDCRALNRPNYCSQCGAQLRCDPPIDGKRTWLRETSQHTIIRARPHSAPRRFMQSLKRSHRLKRSTTSFGNFNKSTTPQAHVRNRVSNLEDARRRRSTESSINEQDTPRNMPREFMDIVIARRHRRRSVSYLPTCTQPRSRKWRSEPTIPIDDCRTIQELADRVFKWLEEHPAEEDTRLMENFSQLGSVKDFYRVR